MSSALSANMTCYVGAKGSTVPEPSGGRTGCRYWAKRQDRPAKSTQFRTRTVNDVMTLDPVTVAASTSLREASRLIEYRGFKRLPVVENGKLVGIIARADLVRALAYGRNGVAATTPDVSVTEQLRELERQNWRNRVRVMKPF